MSRIPKRGWVWNPLRNFPRNADCPCRSGKKFKKCCLPSVKDCCRPEDAKKLKELVDRADAS